MGMPIITPGTGTRDQAITDLIESVALQETALSHILNAEGEKMQAIINNPDSTTEELMELNNSVNKLVNAVMRMEMLFHAKLELFSDETPAPAPTTAADVLASIDVPTVSIDVALTDEAAQQAAINAAIAAAQAQAEPGFTVTFTPSGYDPTGSLTGTFTVTNDANPADTATDTADRTIAVTSTFTTAALQLANIALDAVTITVPLSDPTAQQAAVDQAIIDAQALVSPDYTVSFAASGYSPTGVLPLSILEVASDATGLLTGVFTVTNNNDATDTATDLTDRNITVYSTAPSSYDQLAKINVSSVTINVALDDSTAQQAAVNQAIADAQALVSPGYTVNFMLNAYDTAGSLTGRYTVTNDADSTDTATDSADRTIAVISTFTPAMAELAKINSITTVEIAVPLDDGTAQQAAVDQAIADAQLLVAPGYTVDFTPTGYVNTGLLTGKFTVTNSTDATDTAADTTDRNITVTSSAAPVTPAAAELAKINTTTVTIDVPLDDGTAQQAAVDQAIAAAQLIVTPGYTVDFTPTGYDNTGLLTGKFTVTNSTDPTDTAADTTDRNISVTSSVSTATAISNAEAQLISGSLLGIDLSDTAGLLAATAHYENGVTPGTVDTDNTGVDLSALDTTLLAGVIDLGVINQYAKAFIDGVSEAISNVAGAGVNLIPLVSFAPELISAADVSIGAITGAAQWDAKLGATIANTTDVTAPAQGRGYDIADADLNLVSPVLGDTITAISDATGTISDLISGFGSQIINGVLDGFGLIMDILNGLVPGLDILGNDLDVQFSLVNLDKELSPIIDAPITSDSGIVTLNIGEGTVDIDLGALGLNGLDPSTNLLSEGTINSIISDVGEIVLALQAKLQELVISKLTGTIGVTISGGVTLLDTALLSAGIGVSFDGTLADLVTGTSKITLSGTGALEFFSDTINGLASTVQDAVAAVLNPLINNPDTGLLAVAANALTSALSGVSTALSPVFQAIASVISIVINVQENGTNTFTEIPLQLNILSSAGAALNIGRVMVGPNSYTA